MSKYLSLIVVLIISSHLNGQWFGKKIKGNGNVVTTTRKVSDYNDISVGGSFDVSLVAGKEGELTIKGEENLFDYLITEADNGVLKIKWKKGISVRTNKKFLITVPFEDIEGVSLAGSGNITSRDMIKSDFFKISLSGSGDFNLNLKVEELSSSVSGSGNIKLSGSADKLKCSIAGSGDFNAYELFSIEADVRIAGSGEIKIDVADKLKARVSGSGDIFYRGNPKFQDVKVSGSGTVSSK
jgi:hypothetical protein